MTLMLLATLISTVLAQRYSRSEDRMMVYTIAVALAALASVLFWLDPAIGHLIRRIVPRSPHFLLYLAFLILSQLVSILISSRSGIRDFVWGLTYAFVGFISYFVFPAAIAHGLFRRWLTLLIGAGVIVSGVGLYVSVTGATSLLGLDYTGRLRPSPFGTYVSSSIFHEANRSALVAFFGCVGLLYFLSKREHPVLSLAQLIICVANIVITWSRAVYISLFLGFLVWILVRVKPSRRLGIAFGLIVLSAVAVCVAFSVEYLYYLMFGQGWAFRDIVWPAALRAILDRPLWGYGIGSESSVYEVMYAYSGLAFSVHSTPLGLAFHVGIPAALLWVWVIVISIGRLVRSNLNSLDKASLLAGITGALVAAIFLDYNLGGINYGSFVQSIFLGLANVSPYLRGQSEGELSLQ